MTDFKEMAKKWQKKWDEAKTFEVAPKDKEKFFITIPYPYISGSLHIGHSRVVTEADVYARFQRMIGKNTLYPMAFHISGTPVLGISLALKNKDPKKIALYKGYIKQYIKDDKEVEKILESFQDPEKIVEFFIPKMKAEFKTLGLSVDWRRTYTSGDMEHQALVEWQFKKYKEMNYLVQGKYPILFSKSLNNAVGEDDIQDGDTNPVEMQEFTLIKFKFGDAYLIAATLRPETMYGQTNMWVNPDIEYVKVDVNGEKWIISKECAEKLKYQDKKVEILETIKGKELMGKTCFAPFVEKEIIILPSLHCDPKICSGIVTSVPGDAPFDYIALKELQDSDDICKKYNIDYEKVKNIELIPIIKSKGYGELPAVEICEKMGITSLSQHDKLTEATQEIYKLGFHTGVMKETCGPYAGKTVNEAKEGMKQKILEENQGEIFYETSRSAYSRDGGEVIVAILDGQWFLDFNAEGWKEKASQCLAQIELWPEKYRKQFDDVFAWLDKRPCARKRGLGTKLPFDKEWIIESLSDSTIYMSLYPIIHTMREHSLKKEQLTSEFFDYVMNSEGNVDNVEKQTGISKEVLEDMNKEWNYWYPFDHRHTFTAHLSNHLSFMIFAHTAIFKQKHWPKRISFHGMIMSEGEKMSKSKGNVISLMEISEKFGPDPFRAFMCNSVSVESTFNWQTEKVMIMQKHLASLYDVLAKMQQNKDNTENYKKYASFLSKTERAIKRSREAFESMDIRDYSNVILYEMLNNYKQLIKTIIDEDDIKSINSYIGNRWIAMMTPLVPHLAEELWSLDSGNKTFVSEGKWPNYDENLIDEGAEYEDYFMGNLRDDINAVLKMARIETPKKIKLFVSSEWKYEFINIFKSEIETTRNIGELLKKIMQTDLKRYGQNITKILPGLVKDPSKIPLVVKTQKEEIEMVNKSRAILEKDFNLELELIKAEDSKEAKANQAMPGKPAIVIE